MQTDIDPGGAPPPSVAHLLSSFSIDFITLDIRAAGLTSMHTWGRASYWNDYRLCPKLGDRMSANQSAECGLKFVV